MMLSRILHRKPAAVPTKEDNVKTIVATIKSHVEPLRHVKPDSVDFFAQVMATLKELDDGGKSLNAVLMHLASDNGNTSYIEPFLEAAYTHDHPQRSALGAIYTDFVATQKPTHLAHKLLDERFYSNSAFPVHSFSLLGNAGVQLSQHQQQKWLHRALVSQTPVEQIRASATALHLDLNEVKDHQQRTVLHDIMLEGRVNDHRTLVHVLSRAKQLGIETTPDIFGRYPDEFGTAQTRIVFSQHFQSYTQAPASALGTYLANTVHDFSGVHAIGSKDTEIYLKKSNAVDHPHKTSLFEHVLRSHDIKVISELQHLVEPRVFQHADIEKTLPSIFLDRYVCGPDAKEDVVNDVFALLQNDAPKDLSTALGFLLMHSDAYYQNYSVDPTQLAKYMPAIERVMAYQREHGLTDLLALETAALERVLPAPESSYDTMAP